MIEYTVKVFEDRTEWHLNGQRHRTDGPAAEYSNGVKAWYLNGKLHRTDGPAVECNNGYKEWWINGKLHRADGPAIEQANGHKSWWINGQPLTQSEFNAKIAGAIRVLLESSGVILRGHFKLSSGRHSDVYFEKFRILERPDVLSALCGEIAAHFKGNGIEYVAGPTTGGIIIAFEVARQMQIQAVYVETENGEKKLRRGKTLPEGAKVLVVDDVLTMGTSVLEVVRVVGNAGGTVEGVGILIDRAETAIDFGASYYAAYKVQAKSFAESEIPDWLAAVPLQKPGTRK